MEIRRFKIRNLLLLIMINSVFFFIARMDDRPIGISCQGLILDVGVILFFCSNRQIKKIGIIVVASSISITISFTIFYFIDIGFINNMIDEYVDNNFIAFVQFCPMFIIDLFSKFPTILIDMMFIPIYLSICIICIIINYIYYAIFVFVVASRGRR